MISRLASVKDPAAVLDYGVDWLDGGYLDGRTINASSWSVEPVEPGGLVIASPAVSGGKATAMISGGIVGHLYQLTNRIVTNAGTTEERSILIRIEQR